MYLTKVYIIGIFHSKFITCTHNIYLWLVKISIGIQGKPNKIYSTLQVIYYLTY